MKKSELKQKLIDWAKGNKVQLPGIFDDLSGISGLQTVGCGCCSKYALGDLGLDHDDDCFEGWTQEDQLDVVKGILKGILEEYNLTPEDLK